MTLKLLSLPGNTEAPRVTSTRDESGAVLVRIEPARVDAPDELVPLSDSGLEERAWKALIRSGELKARKLGRRWYTTKSALVGLVLSEAPPKAMPAQPIDQSYAAILAQPKRAVSR